MPLLQTDLELIDTIHQVLDRGNAGDLESQRAELRAIYAKLQKSLAGEPSSNGSAPQDLLPDYLNRFPETLETLSEAVVRETIDYAIAVCDYYREIKTQRPLTEEEKNFGRQMKRLLTDASELL